MLTHLILVLALHLTTNMQAGNWLRAGKLRPRHQLGRISCLRSVYILADPIWLPRCRHCCMLRQHWRHLRVLKWEIMQLRMQQLHSPNYNLHNSGLHHHFARICPIESKSGRPSLMWLYRWLHIAPQLHIPTTRCPFSLAHPSLMAHHTHPHP